MAYFKKINTTLGISGSIRYLCRRYDQRSLIGLNKIKKKVPLLCRGTRDDTVAMQLQILGCRKIYLES